MFSEKGSRVIALRGRTSGRALYCGRKVSSLVVRDAGGAMWLSSGTRVTPQDDRMSLGVPVCVLRRAGRPWRSAANRSLRRTSALREIMAASSVGARS